MPPKRKQKIVAKKRPEARTSMVRKQIIVGIVLVVLISLLLTAVYFISHIESKQITRVKVLGGSTIPHSEIEKIVNDHLVGDYYRLVPKTFAWTYPENRIREAINSLDRVKNVQVELNGLEITVVFDEHVPQALWCGAEDANCYFLDRNGYSFALAPNLSGSAFVRYSDSSMEPKKDQQAFAAEFMRNNEEFVELLAEELGLYVISIEKLGEEDVDYRVSGGGRIKTSQTIALDKSFRNLRTVLQSEEFVYLEPGKFNYIDLRFGDKVFVNEDLGPADISSSTEAELEE